MPGSLCKRTWPFKHTPGNVKAIFFYGLLYRLSILIAPYRFCIKTPVTIVIHLRSKYQSEIYENCKGPAALPGA